MVLYLEIKLPISPWMMERMFDSCEFIALVMNGFALVPFFAMDLAMTKGGILIHFRLAQRLIADTGGIFPGLRPSCTHLAYSLVFISSHLSPEKFSR